MAIVLAIAAAGLMVGTATAAAASPPWWLEVTVAGAGAGLGSVGGPLGSIAGAMASTALLYYLYNIGGATSKTPASTSYYAPYVSSVINSTYNQLEMLNSSLGTQSQLSTTSYYYFAQSMEAAIPSFLNQSALNQTYMGYLSGMYAAADNISRSVIYPLNSIFFNTYEWAAENSGSISNGAFTGVTVTPNIPSIFGFNMSKGSTYFIIPQSDFYFFGNASIALTNTLTGGVYYVNHTAIITQAPTYSVYSSSGYEKTGAYLNNVTNTATATAGEFNIPTGIYTVTSFSDSAYSIRGDTFDPSIPVSAAVATDAFQLTPTGALEDTANMIYWMTYYNSGYMGNSASTGFKYGINQANYLVVDSSRPYYGGKGGSAFPLQYGAAFSVSQKPINTVLSNVPGELNSVVNTMGQAFMSANAYFQTLHNEGYTNASSLPSNKLVPFPSWFVPTALLNGTFNLTEMQALYYAYLNQIGNWYNASRGSPIKANQSVDNTTFTNGFIQVFGNLTVHNGGTKYYNQTWFLPLISVGSWPFKVGSWTNVTNNMPDPEFLVTSGADAGQMIDVTNGTFYTLGITVNGTSTQSYTIQPVTISYVLPPQTSIGKVPGAGGFFSGSRFGLPVWEWIAVVFITAVVIGTVYSTRKRGD